MKLCILTILLTCSLEILASQQEVQVVYGEDNRQDIYTATDSIYHDVASATAAQINNFQLEQKENGNYKLRYTFPLSQTKNVCKTEQFANQPTVAGCTGFLIAKDILVTAGHCFIRRVGDFCQMASWVFDYKMESKDSINMTDIPADNVYKCKEIIKAQYDRPVIKKGVVNYGLDFAIIRLDREVKERKPLAIRTNSKITIGQNIAVVGHPTGLPLKVADGATVLNNKNANYFSTNLDSFHGNSGSPVIDSDTGMVEGILVRGKPDYITSNHKDPDSCNILNRCDDDRTHCMADDPYLDGEQVTRISAILEYL